MVQSVQQKRNHRKCQKLLQNNKILPNGYQPRIFGRQDKTNNTTNEPAKLLNIWKEDFQELLNCEDSAAQEHYEEGIVLTNTRKIINLIMVEPTLTEIVEVLKTCRNGKASGQDMIPIEILKNGGVRLEEMLLKVWRTKSMPNE